MKRYLLLALGAALVACSGETDAPPAELPPLLEVRTSGQAVFGHPTNNCQECHPQHVAEWSMSSHAYSAKDPVFHAMTNKGQKDRRGRLGQFCIQCHSPVALALNTAPIVEEDGVFKQKVDQLPEIEQMGVSCDVCHSISEIIQPVNARAVLSPDGTRRGGIENPIDTPAHKSLFDPLQKQSLVCGMCHAVINGAGARLEETFPEWQASSFAKPGGKTCQGCHMEEYDGPAAPNGPTRKLHRHYFTGVDVSLRAEGDFPGYAEMRQRTTDMLKSAASVATMVDAPDKKVHIDITNLAGHGLPSGATAERKLWIEMIVRSSTGAVVFETGTLDENGNLRDNNRDHTTRPGSDPQLIEYGQSMLDDPTAADPNSTAPIKEVSFLWEATAVRNRIIAPDATERRVIDLAALPAGSYTATVRLLFRSFPAYFLIKLEHDGALDPAVKERVPLVEIHSEQLQFTLP